MTGAADPLGDVARAAAWTYRHLAPTSSSAPRIGGRRTRQPADHSRPDPRRSLTVNALLLEQLTKQTQREAHTQARQARLVRLAKDQRRTARAVKAARTTR